MHGRSNHRKPIAGKHLGYLTVNFANIRAQNILLMWNKEESVSIL